MKWQKLPTPFIRTYSNHKILNIYLILSYWQENALTLWYKPLLAFNSEIRSVRGFCIENSLAALKERESEYYLIFLIPQLQSLRYELPFTLVDGGILYQLLELHKLKIIFMWQVLFIMLLCWTERKITER